ncbi:MAG TPA: hypothetical protein VKA95_14290 [Nitrososphaeraceae archaeon]|nr:hypothetical protein [Nitrososphaeraceae archaeon]
MSAGEGISVQASIDGKQLQHRIQSPLFNVTLPEDITHNSVQSWT